MDKTTLNDGTYLGVERSFRDFSFTLPKVTQGPDLGNMSMDDFFDQLHTGIRPAKAEKPAQTNQGNPVGKTTSFSGWKYVSGGNTVNITSKCLAAPAIWRAADGSDPEAAANMVSRFKRSAAKVLAEYADGHIPVDQAMADRINVNACVVNEIRIFLLKVSPSKIDESSTQDPKSGKWYTKKVIRKFFLTVTPTDDLLQAFARELADSDTNVNAKGVLYAVRSDKVTARTGYAAYTSGFRIQRVSDLSSSDEGLAQVIQRIKQNQAAKINSG